MTDSPSLVRRFLLAFVGMVIQRPRLVLAVSLALCVASGLAATFHLKYHTSRDDLVSSGKDYQRRWQGYLDEFGEDDDIVVVVQGTNHDRMKAALDKIAVRLEQHPDLFDRIFYKVDLRHLKNRALMLAPIERLEKIKNQDLAEMGRLLDSGRLGWHLLGLHSVILEAKERTDERFLRQLDAVCAAATRSLRGEVYQSPWTTLGGDSSGREEMLEKEQYFFSGDGQLAFLLVRPVKEAGSFTAALTSVQTARQIIADAREDHPELHLGLTGLPVLETDEMLAAEKDTRLASWLAIAGVTLLFLLVYRGIAYPVLTVITLLAGTAWAFGWLTLTVGHLNILSTTFAVMLIGMGDYGVLWVMRYEHARKQGMDVREALLHTTTHVAIGNLTAASTLALAFFAALAADFKAVAELGWIAGWGVLLCAFACFSVLPSLLILFDRRGVLPLSVERVETRERALVWLPWVGRRPGVILALGLMIALALGWCASRISYDHNLLNLQAQELESVKWERKLIDHTAGSSWHALSIRATREETLALKQQFEQLPQVSRVVEVASLVPPDQERKRPLVRALAGKLETLPKRGSKFPHAPTDLGELRKDLAAVCVERRSVAELRATLDQQSPALVGERLKQFDQAMAEDLLGQLHRLRDLATPEMITVNELPRRLRERYIGRNGQWLLRVFARDDLWEFGPLEEFTHTIQKVDPEATGKPFTTVAGLKAMRDGLVRAGIYAFLVIVLVLWLDFRGLRNTLLALMPLVLGVVLSVGLLSLFGLPLNPANMIAFPLILGVGVDNGVHVLHDYLIRRKEGREGISPAIGRGVLVKALTTMIGFATLMISTERGLVGLGLILTLGVGCSMVAALVLLPAALAWLGREQQRSEIVVQERRAA